jgi:hypothetical protein
VQYSAIQHLGIKICNRTLFLTRVMLNFFHLRSISDNVLENHNAEATAFWYVKYNLSVLNYLKVSFINFGIYKKCTVKYLIKLLN